MSRASLRLSDAEWLAIEREYCRRSFASFVKEAWHVIEPATVLKWGWAPDAICEHLQAVTEGHLKNVLINVPPGTMKSLLLGVFWPAWEWGPRGLAHMRFLGTAHSMPLAIRDNRKCRLLIESEWYQQRWPITLTTDQNTKTKFENDKLGFREAMAFTSLTGSRGNRVLVDDPISADNANSDAHIEAARLSLTETVPTRINDDKSAILIIMQRLNERDASGVILEMGLDFEHLMIPMRFEPERKCYTSIGWEDPRTKPGELMFQERFSEDAVIQLEKTLGGYATAGQLQQRPAPREGGMFKLGWFGRVKAIPNGTRFVRGWDLAASTEKDSAYSAGVKIGKTPRGDFIIAHAVRDRLTAGGVVALMKSVAAMDGRECRISIPQDPGQAGKAQAQDLVRHLAGYSAKTSPESGDKVTRAEPLAAQAEAGNVYILETGDPDQDAWTKPFLDEITVFPGSRFKDQTDAATRAFDALVSTSTYTLEGV